MEVVPTDSAKDKLVSEMASGDGPDVIGIAGWNNSAPFHGQFLDMTPYIVKSGYDIKQFDPDLVKAFQTDEGQEGLPFAMYPSALFFNKTLFDRAHLAYPPARYGDSYQMPDGSMADWDWGTLSKVAQLLSLDSSGKNSTQVGFNKSQIVQYGYTWNFEDKPNYWGSYWGSGSLVKDMHASKGNYAAQIPDAWKAAWDWTYNGIWGSNPFIGNSSVYGSADFQNGNPFDSGKVAMTDQPVWYTCCINEVKTWDFAAMPSYNGKTAGRIDADTFRIWKGTKHPDEAFTVVAYLVGEGVKRLIIGANGEAPAFGAIPARDFDRQVYFDGMKKQFPWVKNWDTLNAGFYYPDTPNAEAYLPNYDESWNHMYDFGKRLNSTSGLDLNTEETNLVKDLTDIFNK
jgi:multiple sugar transport system substrate-binding protein